MWGRCNELNLLRVAPPFLCYFDSLLKRRREERLTRIQFMDENWKVVRAFCQVDQIDAETQIAMDEMGLVSFNVFQLEEDDAGRYPSLLWASNDAGIPDKKCPDGGFSMDIHMPGGPGGPGGPSGQFLPGRASTNTSASASAKARKRKPRRK